MAEFQNGSCDLSCRSKPPDSNEKCMWKIHEAMLASPWIFLREGVDQATDLGAKDLAV